MTIKYTYKCDTCSHNYFEQRGEDEPNAYITLCNYCDNGTYGEISKEILSSEPERVAAPIVEELPILEEKTATEETPAE